MAASDEGTEKKLETQFYGEINNFKALKTAPLKVLNEQINPFAVPVFVKPKREILSPSDLSKWEKSQVENFCLFYLYKLI